METCARCMSKQDLKYTARYRGLMYKFPVQKTNGFSLISKPEWLALRNPDMVTRGQGLGSQLSGACTGNADIDQLVQEKEFRGHFKVWSGAMGVTLVVIVG